MTTNSYSPMIIWNVDETGIKCCAETRPHSSHERCEGSWQDDQWGEGEERHSTMCTKRGDNYKPPMFIFPGQRMAEGLMRDAH